jgi:hypothetical protein
LELVTEAIDLDPDELTMHEMEEAIDHHIRLCGLVEALNEWIRKGGALPDVWQQAHLEARKQLRNDIIAGICLLIAVIALAAIKA